MIKTNKQTLVSLSVRVFAICTIVLSVFCTGWASQAKISVPQSDEAGLQISFDLDELDFSLKQAKGGNFVELNFSGAAKYGEIGTAALPIVRKLFVAPDGAQVSVDVSAGKPEVIDLEEKGFTQHIIPVQPPIAKRPGAREKAEFRYNKNAYTNAQYLPAKRVTIKELGIMRGQRLFMLEIRPVSYNPAAGKIMFWPQLEAKVSFKGGKKISTGVMPAELESTVLNPEILSEDKPIIADNYLIIVASAYETTIAPFATAKANQGFVVTTYSVGPGTTNVDIKSYIQSLWGTADVPHYILLVGDTDTIPSWTGSGEATPHTDLPYACMDGPADWFPDMAIGRFPVRTVGQLSDVIDKTLAFEDGQPAADYFNKAVFMASSDNYSITESTHNWVIDNYMTPNNIVSDKLYTYTYSAVSQDVRDAFNDGRLYGIYSGHGGEYLWADGPVFNQNDIRNLTNTDLYPLVLSFACVTGSYFLDECLTETWLLVPEKGAVAVYGASVDSYWIEDDQLEKVFFEALFDDDIRQIGRCWNATMAKYLTVMGSGSMTRGYFEMYNLMGDPSLYIPYPEPPTGLTVSPRSDMDFSGPQGGPFAPNNFIYTLTNNNDTPIDYEVTADQSWVSIDNLSGTLSAHETVGVTISFGPQAYTLAIGGYSAIVNFVNTTDSDGDTSRDLTLKVGTPTVQYLWNMDTDPGWTMQGQWAWGQPTGGGGEYGGPDPTSGYTDNNVLGYNLNGDYSNSIPQYFATTNAIDCSGLIDVHLEFQRWLGVEGNTYDHAKIEVSSDATNWTAIWENAGTEISDSSWTAQSYDISQVADDQPTVYIRWSLGPTDSSWRYCGWNIDDVQILAIGGSPAEPITQQIVNIRNRTAPPGGTIGPFTIVWTNNTTSEYSLLARQSLLQLGEPPIRLRPIAVDVTGNEEITIRRTLKIPPSSTPGRYRYKIVLIDPTDRSIIDQDWFNYRIVPDSND